jgi:sulfofructose kinase
VQMNEKKLDVIGFGDPFQDLVIRLSQLPPTNVNMRMDDYCFQGGGNVATAMVAAARLGLRSAVLGNVGDDLLGRMILSDLRYNHVDVSRMKTNENARSNFCLCMAEQANQGKEFISKGGDFSPLQPSELDRAFIRSARVLHIGNFTPAIVQACEWMHEAGGIVSIDAAYYRPDIFKNYRHIDLFIASETYYNTMRREEKIEEKTGFEDVLRAIQAKGPSTVIVTLGAAGCKGVSGSRYFEIPAFQVETVDSTGAGDVFHGAYVYAWLQGWEAERCCRFCSAVSAIKCTRMGGRSGIPTLPVISRFLQDGVIDGEELDRRVLHYKYGSMNP